jgi:hypothetical protein
MPKNNRAALPPGSEPAMLAGPGYSYFFDYVFFGEKQANGLRRFVKK